MYVVLLNLNSFAYSVPELSFIEPQGLTSDHVKELTEEVEKLAKENVGEVRGGGGEKVWMHIILWLCTLLHLKLPLSPPLPR